MREDVDEYIEYMQQVKGLKNGTINAKLRAIRALLHFLHESILRERVGNIEAFTVKQLQALLNAPDRRTFTGQRDYTFMLLLLETGIRLKEAEGKLVEGVKLSEGLVFIS